MLPPVLLPSGHRMAHPAVQEEWDGKAAPHHTPGSSTQPLPAVTAAVPLSLCIPCSSSIPDSTAGGNKKALSVKPRKSKDVNAPRESGDVSLFPKKTPGMEQGDLSVVSGLVRDRGCDEAKEGGAMPRARSSPEQCFWECQGSGVKGKCCR